MSSVVAQGDKHGLRLLSLGIPHPVVVHHRYLHIVLHTDGGGIRGLSELLILKEIMERIQAKRESPTIPLPCEYFDMMGGSGTGG